MFPIFKRHFEVVDPQRVFEQLPADLLTTSVARSKEQAKAEMEEVVATGGVAEWGSSGHDEGRRDGGAADTAIGLHFGVQEEHTVFEAEVTGEILALDIIKVTPRLTSADIFINCQPAITAISAPRNQPGQHLLAAFPPFGSGSNSPQFLITTSGCIDIGCRPSFEVIFHPRSSNTKLELFNMDPLPACQGFILNSRKSSKKPYNRRNPQEAPRGCGAPSIGLLMFALALVAAFHNDATGTSVKCEGCIHRGWTLQPSIRSLELGARLEGFKDDITLRARLDPVVPDMRDG
ncbi:hypothetical protein B0H17DRAFT_1147036 [Mycena rosella]|uniref:Uncharacterized protein n=1 Tax=Mycena rosella TaxID=1033263 RepID=A0AAD7G0M7_MYCRO|nr:hypothetical protein B0H17DRAFT_1147036 [Mycena rosella]